MLWKIEQTTFNEFFLASNFFPLSPLMETSDFSSGSLDSRAKRPPGEREAAFSRERFLRGPFFMSFAYIHTQLQRERERVGA